MCFGCAKGKSRAAAEPTLDYELKRLGEVGGCMRILKKRRCQQLRSSNLQTDGNFSAAATENQKVTRKTSGWTGQSRRTAHTKEFLASEEQNRITDIQKTRLCPRFAIHGKCESGASCVYSVAIIAIWYVVCFAVRNSYLTREMAVRARISRSKRTDYAATSVWRTKKRSV